MSYSHLCFLGCVWLPVCFCLCVCGFVDGFICRRSANQNECLMILTLIVLHFLTFRMGVKLKSPWMSLSVSCSYRYLPGSWNQRNKFHPVAIKSSNSECSVMQHFMSHSTSIRDITTQQRSTHLMINNTAWKTCFQDRPSQKPQKS